MNTKLLICFVCSMMMLCACELGTDRVYMEMYEAMNTNSDAIENSIESRTKNILQDVKRKPDYKPIAVVAMKIDDLTSDFVNFTERIDEYLDERNFDAINDDKIKSSIVSYRHEIIDAFKGISDNKILAIGDEEIQNLIQLHFFPNGTLPPVNGKPFDDYSFKNQSIACNKAILAKHKNDALMLAKISVDYLGSKVGATVIGCFTGPVVVSVPKKNFFIKGETFETEIFLYYPHTTHHSKIEMIIKVDGKEVPTRGGVATYKTTPTVYGEHTYLVEISIKNPFSGRFERYRRTFSFEVGERCYL